MSSFRRWSNSSLSTLQRCSHQFYLKYIKKQWRDSGPAAKRGIAVHHVAKEGHKRQMTIMDLWKGSDPEMEEEPGSEASVEEARDLAASVFEEQWARGVKLSERDLELGKKLVKAQHKDVAVDIAGFYTGHVAPTVNPVAVERKIDVDSKTLDATLVGVVDLIEDQDGNEYIRDLKSKEKKPWKFEADESVSDDLIQVGRSEEADFSSQLTLYSLIRYADVKKLPHGQRLVTVARTPKTAKTTAYIAETTRDMDDIRILGRRIRTAIQAVDKGVFVPADPGAPASPCGWCDYNDGTCEYVRRGGSPAIAVQKDLPLEKPKRYIDLKKEE